MNLARIVEKLRRAIIDSLHISNRVITNLGNAVGDNQLLAHRHLLMAGLAGWAFFSIYWDFCGQASRPTKNRESRGSRALHVSMANVATLLTIAPVRVLGRFVAVSPQLMIGGAAMVWIGAIFAIWARSKLGSNWSGEISIKVGHQLIRSGPYRVLRHPIYSGLLAMYVGSVLVTGEGLALLGLSIAVVAYWRKIRLEERSLRIAFGRYYEAYRGETWAVLPGLF